VLQNARIKKGMNQDPLLQMTVSLEEMTHRTVVDGSLQVIRPRFVWWELTAKDAVKPLRLSWGNLTAYPAPVWTLEAPDWNSLKPQPEHSLSGWIWTDQFPQAVASPSRDMRKPYSSDFQELIRFENQEVQIESIRFEDRDVEIEPDKSARRNCLVLRAHYTPKHPVMFKLGGNVKPAGAEHYYYDHEEGAKYTAIFWGVTEDQVNDRTFALDVISIDAVKKEGLSKVVPQKAPDVSQRP
jgi:hypothetical protein